MSDRARPRPAHTASRPLPTAVLASGRGSNLAALIDAREQGELPVTFTLVAGDRTDAPALRRAEACGIPTLGLEPRGFPTRRAFDEALLARVAESGAQLVVMAGYMRILDASLVEQWRGRMINIHPSLLPKYRGLHTHRRALLARDSVHGASVHFVDAELDGGPVIAQARVAIHPGDTGEALAARLLPHEHRLLVACVAAIASGAVWECDGRVWFEGAPLRAPLRLGASGRILPA